MPVYDPKRAFPPTQGTFTLKNSSDVLPPSVWTRPGEKPIRLSKEMKVELAIMLVSCFVAPKKKMLKEVRFSANQPASLHILNSKPKFIFLAKMKVADTLHFSKTIVHNSTSALPMLLVQ